jgi:hypothetical protein
MLAAIDKLAGNDFVVEDFFVGVDVAEEVIEGGDALGEAALNEVPLSRSDQARQQIIGKDALGAFVAAVDGEGDSLGEEGKVGRLLAALQFLLGQSGEGFGQRAVVGALRASRRRPDRADNLRTANPSPRVDWRSWAVDPWHRFRVPDQLGEASTGRLSCSSLVRPQSLFPNSVL